MAQTCVPVLRGSTSRCFVFFVHQLVPSINRQALRFSSCLPVW